MTQELVFPKSKFSKVSFQNPLCTFTTQNDLILRQKQLTFMEEKKTKRMKGKIYKKNEKHFSLD